MTIVKDAYQRARGGKRRPRQRTTAERLRSIEESLTRVEHALGNHVEPKLDRAIRLLQFVAVMEKKAMKELDDLEAQVTQTNGVAESARVLLEGIIDRLDQAGTDPVKLAALSALLNDRSTALAAAVAAIPPRP